MNALLSIFLYKYYNKEIEKKHLITKEKQDDEYEKSLAHAGDYCRIKMAKNRQLSLTELC